MAYPLVVMVTKDHHNPCFQPRVKRGENWSWFTAFSYKDNDTEEDG